MVAKKTFEQFKIYAWLDIFKDRDRKILGPSLCPALKYNRLTKIMLHNYNIHNNVVQKHLLKKDIQNIIPTIPYPIPIVLDIISPL